MDDDLTECIEEMMDQGMGEDEATEFCQMQQSAPRPEVRHKVRSSLPNGNEYVLSDETVDRYGDVLIADGWDLDNFRKNPIALFNHRSDFPIGRWENLRVVKKSLRGNLILAPGGTSERVDELRRLIEAGILRAVSVGFRPLERKPRGNDQDGYVYVKNELVETSLVSIPANPNALQVAKSLQISDDTMRLVFGEQAGNGSGVMRRRSIHGGHAGIHSRRGDRPMTLAERIQNAQERINQLKDQLDAHLASVDDDNPTEANTAVTVELTKKISEHEGNLQALKDAESRIVSTIEPPPQVPAVVNRGNGSGRDMVARPFSVPIRKMEARDYIWRTTAALVVHHNERNKRSLVDVMKEIYGDDEPTRQMLMVLTRAASVPADTVTSGWASQLVNTAIGEFFEALMPVSIYPRISAAGGRFTFGRNGVVSMPTRAPTPTIAGSFVGQGAPIPVRQGAFTAIALTPKKMAVISTFTREIAEHSTPAIEGLIRQAIVEDTAVSIDTVLLDNNAATTIRPAGIRNGVTGQTPTAGGGFNALTADLKALVGVLVTGTNGNVRAPMWLMNPADVLSASLTANTAGDFPFKAELAAGTLLGYPVVQSATVPAKMVILLDAADFVSATGDVPRFDVSDQATLHMEDTTPLQIATGPQGTGVLATPTRSLWQTDTMGVRMIMDINWALRRTGTVAWVSAITW